MDLGCGDGELCRRLLKADFDFERFIGVDISPSMLALHPEGERVVKLCADFNDIQTLKSLTGEPFDTVLSSSALQWASNLDRTLCLLSKIGKQAAFSIFTAGTFRTLHEYLGIDSPIRDSKRVLESLLRYYEPYRYELRSYRLDFSSRRELFTYIKRSGVSGGRAILSVAQMRRLLREYPYLFLEFEVLFFLGSPKSSFSS